MTEENTQTAPDELELLYPPETKALKDKYENDCGSFSLLRLCKEQTSLLIKLENERDWHRMRDALLTKATQNHDNKKF